MVKKGKNLPFRLICNLNSAFLSVVVSSVVETLLYSKNYDFALGFILYTCVGTGSKRRIILE
jgi:hypothetical protein